MHTVPRPTLARCRRVAAAGVVVLVASLLAGCGLFSSPTTEVALVGDSITDQSRDTFRDRLGDDYLLDVRAFPGVRTDEWVGQARLAASEEPSLAVVNLGTNDVYQQWPVEQSMAAMRAILDELGAVPCRYVVTVNERMFSFDIEDLPDRAQAFNAALRALAAEEAIEVLDWAAVVAAELDAGEPNGAVTSDTVHPTDYGEKLLADLYRDGMDACELPLLPEVPGLPG